MTAWTLAYEGSGPADVTSGRTVVIGIGDERRGDDAAGPEAVRLLAGAVPAHVTIAAGRGIPPSSSSSGPAPISPWSSPPEGPLSPA
ncbi:hypothetical protein [Planobispora longispora]|uniref:hypothetical protein n=1 Tax=Planobispora longispora TaxID=28887 RepID=UPI0035EB4995